MKLCLFLILTVFLSVNLNAQVATGGDHFGSLSLARKQAASKRITTFEKYLEGRITHCTNHGLKIKNKNLIDIYLDLTIYRETHNTIDTCESANAYLKCLNDEKIIIMSKRLRDDDDVILLLTSKYKIEREKAQEILNFFSDLGKKIE